MLTLREYNTKLARLRSTRKMTRTMEMVSANRLRKAQESYREAREYEAGMEAVVRDVAGETGFPDHPLLRARPRTDRVLVALVTSDRGLCGAFNLALCKHAWQWMRRRTDAGARVSLLSLGRRGSLFFRGKAEFLGTDEGLTGRPRLEDARHLAQGARRAYLEGRFDEVNLAYNEFRTVASRAPRVQRLLPLDIAEGGARPAGAGVPLILQPGPDALWDGLLSRLLTARVYRALLGSAAGEHGARMISMENATANAETLIDTYTTLRNQARQAGITSELIEIIAGAEALR